MNVKDCSSPHDLTATHVYILRKISNGWKSFLNLTRDLGVNLAGVEVVLNMRKRMEEMQREMQEFIEYVEREFANRSPELNQKIQHALVKVTPPHVTLARPQKQQEKRIYEDYAVRARCGRSGHASTVSEGDLAVSSADAGRGTGARRARQEGDEDAFRKLIESNLRFVVAMAKKYSRSGYPLHELINEGNLGLIEAASRFDPARGVRFITYASWWIRQAILAAIAHYGQVFRLPPKLKHELYRFETKVAQLDSGTGPSAERSKKSRRSSA